MRVAALLLVALALAGCAKPSDVESAAAPPAGEPAPDEGVSDATDAETANATLASSGPATLYMLPDGALSATPPSEEASVPIDTVVQSPATSASPSWGGKLPVAIDPNTTITVRIFLTSSGASVPARTVPGAFEWPGIGVYFTIGESGFELAADGPDVLVRGDVAEIVITATYPGERLEAGAALSVEIVPYYSHVQTVADVQFVMGPEHPAALTFEGAHAAS